MVNIGSRWELPDTAGRNTIVFEVTGVSKNDECQCAFVKVTCYGRYYSRHEKLVSGINYTDSVDDYNFCLSNVIIKIENLKEMVKKLSLNNIYEDKFAQELSSPRQFDQSLELSFSRIDGIVYSHGKTSCRITYKGGSVRILDVIFNIDQSCVSIFIGGITAQ